MAQHNKYRKTIIIWRILHRNGRQRKSILRHQSRFGYNKDTNLYVYTRKLYWRAYALEKYKALNHLSLNNMGLISLENLPRLEEAQIVNLIKCKFFQIFKLSLMAMN